MQVQELVGRSKVGGWGRRKVIKPTVLGLQFLVVREL